MSALRKLFAVIVLPTASPRNSVAILMISFCDALLRRSTTPASFIRFPSMSEAMSGAACGTRIPTATVTMRGNRINASLETGRGAYSMCVRRSSRVVSARMMGG